MNGPRIARRPVARDRSCVQCAAVSNWFGAAVFFVPASFVFLGLVFMSLLNPALLAGFGLAAIPILLHLLMRAKPKRLMFPALRLILQRKKQNTRRMQLRHLWLLLLRVLVIGLIVLAMTRPSLPAANYALTWFEVGALLFIVAAAVASYFGVMAWWKRQSLPRHLLLTRRTMLRGGVGAVVVLLALAGVAWPYSSRVLSDWKDPAPRVNENVPVAAVFLFDTSPSMAYKLSNLTRLQAAQQFAKDQLGRLPAGSKVAVAASSESSAAAFSVDLMAAQSRIESQEIKATGLPLNDRLRTVLLSQEDDRRRVTAEQGSLPEDKRQDRFVREVYVFTDLAKSAWREESSSLLKDELERLKWVGVYLLDVGATEPMNVSLNSLKLSREAVPAGGTVRVDAVMSSVGQVKPDQTVELHVREGDGPLVKAGQQSVLLNAGAETRVSFNVESKGSFRQGELRLTGSDPLNVDDVSHFTIQTIPTLKVLVVAEQPAVARYWMLALKILSDSKVTDYRTEFRTTDRLRETDLAAFDVVCLINAASPDDATWTKLREFVDAGGGLAVFLGAGSAAAADAQRQDRIDQVAYNREAAQSVLPARLKASLTHSPAKTMDLRNSRHLLLQRLDDLGALTDLGTTEIRRYWKVDPLADAVTIAKYGDTSGPAALIERRLGQGRVVMLTTGVDNISWNDLPDLNNYVYVVLADQLVQYLSRQASGTFNHLVGDEVSLPLDRERRVKKVVVRMPDFKQRPQDVPAESKLLTLRDLSAVGSYTVDAGDKELDYHAGFSLNLPASESDLTRWEKNDLDRVLGEKRYSVSRDPASLERNVEAGRLGQEMYGIVVAFLAAIFALEQFTATWFYRTDET